MGFADIFKKSFLEGFSAGELGFQEILVILFITSCLALYIFLIYRVVTKRTFYSKNFNIALAMLAVITAAIILTIQTSIVVSLGMVGALSIVRFRTAIKDPMDLVFLFWSLSVGIICGAGLTEIAILTSLIVTIGIIFLDRMPIVRVPQILIVQIQDADKEEAVLEIVKKFSKYNKVKTRNLSGKTLHMIFEVRPAEESKMVRELGEIEGMTSVSLMEHDGEVTF